MKRGAWGRLRSTVPPATFPAWTSLVTGVNPGRHGIFDFSARVPGTYRVRFVNGSHRRAPALWTRLSAAGRRVAVLTVPATYPPEPVAGAMVSGFDSPLATAVDAAVAVVSDHGSGGGGGRVVHLSRGLAECGLLAFARPGPVARLAGAGRGIVLRAVPHQLLGGLVRRLPAAASRLESLHRLGGIDWRRTVAFSEELDYHPSVWLNLRGREPEGTVEPTDYDRARDDIARGLLAWRDEAGRAVVRRVWRREELYRGPFVSAAPDLLLELARVDGYTPSCLRSGGPGDGPARVAGAGPPAGPRARRARARGASRDLRRPASGAARPAGRPSAQRPLAHGPPLAARRARADRRRPCS